MANVLDLRRRIRSVKNTRQITKAMKMVSAARLRRAQERALSGRPYAQMMVSILESLRHRAEIYDPKSGECRHPLLMTRPEKNVLLIVVTGDKGFAGAFNANIVKVATQFLLDRPDLGIDLEGIGRKGRDMMRSRFPAATYAELSADELGDEMRAPERKRQAHIEVTGDHPGILQKLEFDSIDDLGRNISQRYINEEIDAAYIVYNEFKSVLSQRVVVEKILPIIEVGKQQIAGAQEMTLEERERPAKQPSAPASASYSRIPPSWIEEAKKFGTAEVDYIYEQPRSNSSAICFRATSPRCCITRCWNR